MTGGGTQHDAARRLAEGVDDPDVRRLFLRLVDDVAGLHRDIAITASAVDMRAEFDGRELCRAVPYRGLIHVQVDSPSPWESRIRDEAGYVCVIDALITAFLKRVGERSSAL